MAGTIPLSLTQQLDEFGKPLAGGFLYLIQAGTTSTPQNGFQDSALTLPLPNPIVLDASGRIPQFFLADGSIKIRLTDKNGLTQITADGILVVGASSGGGGGSPVDPTTLLQTGDIKVSYGTDIISGFVRTNGKTIGSATSGASERANPDCQALFIWLWNEDPNLVVSTGRGASAAADWAANKTITIPDWRGRNLTAIDDMGSGSSGRLSSTYLGDDPTRLGAAGGADHHTLIASEIPAVAFSAQTSGENQPHTHGLTAAQTNGSVSDLTPGSVAGSANQSITTSGPSQDHTHNVNGNIQGGGQAHAILNPLMLATFYLKL